MFNEGRYRAPETGAGGAQTGTSAAAPAAGSNGGSRMRFSPFSIGMQVVALVVVGVFLIAALALIGEARLASVATDSQKERIAIESDRADVAAALTALQRAQSTSSGHLAAFGRAGDAIMAGRSTSAAADLAERALTDFAQSLQQLDASNRSFAVAVAKSAHLRPWDETVDNATEAAFIKAARERIQAMLKITQDLPGGLAGVVLDNQEMTGALRSGNIADARELYLNRQAPKVAALDQSLSSLQAAFLDFGADFALRHTSLMRATETEAEERYDGLHSSFRLQIFLLMAVLCAGGALIAIYGLAIPLADLTAAASRFAEGRFEEPTTVLGRRDEIGRLSRALERIRETVSTEKQTVAQVSREDREAKEAERLERNTMEREIQALRKDRDRLEQELAERDAAAQAAPQISPEVLEAAQEQERAAIRAEVQAQFQAQTKALTDKAQADAQAAAAQFKDAMDKANAEISRLKSELDKKPASAAPDPAQRDAIVKAETEVARLKILVERQNANAVAEAKKHQDALNQAQAEIQRLSDELQAAKTATPAPADNPAQRETLAKAEAEVKRLTDEVQKLRARPPRSPPPPLTPAHAEAEKKLRDQLEAARTEIAKLKNDQVRDHNVARKAAGDALSAYEARIAQIAADAAAERDRLARAAADAGKAAQAAQQTAAAAQEDLRRLTSALALEQQAREDQLAEARATHARQMTELQNRMAEQQADRAQVVAELVNGFEATIANGVAAVAAAVRDVTLVSGQIGEAAQRAGQQRGDLSARVGRASASIQTAANAAQQIATAFDDLTQQLGQSVNAASGATASARFVNEAVQSLDAAAQRIGEAGAVINDLAERTNMLSLNASIEAAKAGDAGKGFVVVAAEIKSLANRTARTGKELGERIKAVSTAAGSVRSAFAGVNTALNELDTLAAKTARAVALQSTSARTVASGVHAAAEGTESINRTVVETTASLESSGRIVANAQNAARTLDLQAQELRRQIDEFMKAIRSA